MEPRAAAPQTVRPAIPAVMRGTSAGSGATAQAVLPAAAVTASAEIQAVATAVAVAVAMEAEVATDTNRQAAPANNAGRAISFRLVPI